jgi:hypothetical protein
MVNQDSIQNVPDQMIKDQFPENFYQDPLGLDRYVVQEKTLFEWRAPNKVERRRTRSEYLQILLFFVIVSLIMILMGELFLFVVSLAGIFLYFVILSSPPSYLQCSITTIGIKVENKYYFWSQIPQYWFEQKLQTKVLTFRAVGFSAIHQVRLAIAAADEEEIQKVLGKYILLKKPQQSRLELLTDKTWSSFLLLFDYI